MHSPCATRAAGLEGRGGTILRFGTGAFGALHRVGARRLAMAAGPIVAVDVDEVRRGGKRGQATVTSHSTYRPTRNLGKKTVSQTF